MEPWASVEVAERPFNGGHVVIRLKKSIFELSEAELKRLKGLIDSLIKLEKEEFSPEGFNIYITGEEIHIIPRWCGDINVAFFGGIKVIPLSNDDVKENIINKLQ
ncbi:HIT family protein [Pyrobaculum aerophilum]|uniref:HIT family protein n=2 Tax=Pyrobaculum aerophilum TaxID=13773 RepID=Q8ZWS4_PYRAE|nr:MULTISPECIES: HIT family protein [Pyrobaculum]AAL63625.1 hypothetical protein PAE1643 [Pyrobaculum aerophilum str. IM2]MCX8136461.1 HIT family protein [Pyrobaculum aerophilum]RFA95690.1 HIT family protein [Pyrobaculum aerophilum]RFB00195.1 HIT family protein [Pyrobaculum aerophilum]HII46259.1 HIT family protein [Pyrobaculum aerophilum]